MPRATRLLATAAAVLVALLLSGCQVPGAVKVLIPDFASAEVQGIWIWHQTDGMGSFERMTDIQLGESPLSSQTLELAL